ncbi:hypothetical protein [Tautonia rosea]|uniref:hypothetical protein n=1 Tax=Tautonia rosea TaxID=2728037 RepID=UPI0014764DED|nr:hypothetical protein [Tautonia rosea]
MRLDQEAVARGLQRVAGLTRPRRPREGWEGDFVLQGAGMMPHNQAMDFPRDLDPTHQ